ncbi:MAG: hypothetical protein B6I19_04175 [Bacteroidetes bacterium 4572_114]|nr:MAG: hypothetical protein B6I19_04175 [Bacteroidetes bacterium 4572_114]
MVFKKIAFNRKLNSRIVSETEVYKCVANKASHAIIQYEGMEQMLVRVNEVKISKLSQAKFQSYWEKLQAVQSTIN